MAQEFLTFCRMTHKSDISLTFTVAMVTKMAAKVGLKWEIDHFGANFETFDRAINIEHKQIPKRCFNR